MKYMAVINVSIPNEKTYLAFSVCTFIFGIFISNCSILYLIYKHKTLTKLLEHHKFLVAFSKDITSLILIPIIIEIFNGQNRYLLLLFALIVIFYFVIFSFDYYLNHADCAVKMNLHVKCITLEIVIILAILFLALCTLLGLACILQSLNLVTF